MQRLKPRGKVIQDKLRRVLKAHKQPVFLAHQRERPLAVALFVLLLGEPEDAVQFDLGAGFAGYGGRGVGDKHEVRWWGGLAVEGFEGALSVELEGGEVVAGGVAWCGEVGDGLAGGGGVAEVEVVDGGPEGGVVALIHARWCAEDADLGALGAKEEVLHGFGVAVGVHCGEVAHQQGGDGVFGPQDGLPYLQRALMHEHVGPVAGGVFKQGESVAQLGVVVFSVVVIGSHPG